MTIKVEPVPGVLRAVIEDRKGANFAQAGFFSMNIDYRLVGSTPAPGIC